MQCNKPCTNVHAFTLTEKYHFSHIFKVELKNNFKIHYLCSLYEMAFGFFFCHYGPFGFLHSSDYDRVLTVMFWQNSQ